MTTVKLTAHGEADPDSVWQQYIRPALWKQWSPQISGVRIDDGDERCTPTRELVIAAGMSGTVLGPLEPKTSGAKLGLDRAGRTRHGATTSRRVAHRRGHGDRAGDQRTRSRRARLLCTRSAGDRTPRTETCSDGVDASRFRRGNHAKAR
jgi:hypothetical protein